MILLGHVSTEAAIFAVNLPRLLLAETACGYKENNSMFFVLSSFNNLNDTSESTNRS